MIIDQLPEIQSVQGTDEIPIERGQTTYKTKVDGLNKVSKSGDTMTGNLALKNTYEDGEAPNTDTVGTRINITDTHDVVTGRIAAPAFQDGRQGVQLISYRNGVAHSLGIYLDSNGDRVVVTNGASAWLKALGLGTDGALPITVLQGGTGATTAAAARSNLGLSLSSATSTIGNSATVSFPIGAGEKGILILTGSGETVKEIIIYNATNSSSVSYVQIRGATGITPTTAQGTLTIQNNTTNVITVCKITF